MSIINDEDDASNTPLHLAALHGYDKVAKELIDRGAAIDARCEILNSITFFHETNKEAGYESKGCDLESR